MNYKIILTPKSHKQLSKLDKSAQQQVAKILDKLADNPQNQGKQLSGNLAQIWSWRTGDYRILGEIQDNELIILVVKIGHRKNVYN